LGPVFQGVCKSAVNQTVDFAISEILLGDLSEDTFHYGYPNCSWQNSPSPPIALHKPVILFCHPHTYCFEPLPVTPERLASIRDWLPDLFGRAASSFLRERLSGFSPPELAYARA
jgi:hypothetical protein